jgi:hypothetical protein
MAKYDCSSPLLMTERIPQTFHVPILSLSGVWPVPYCHIHVVEECLGMDEILAIFEFQNCIDSVDGCETVNIAVLEIMGV